MVGGDILIVVVVDDVEELCVVGEEESVGGVFGECMLIFEVGVVEVSVVV